VGKRRLEALAVVVFLASLGLNWPFLPLNIRLAELLFIPLAVLLARSLWTTLATSTKPSLSPLDLLAAGYLAGGLPSLLATTDLRFSLVELVRHGYVVAIYAAVAVAVYRGHVTAVMTGMTAGAACLSILGVLFMAAYAIRPFEFSSIGTVLNLPYGGPVLRLRALTATPAMFACLLTAAVPFAIVGAIRETRPRRRAILIATCLVMAAAAVLTFSHVIGGFVAAILIAAWPALRNVRAWRRTGVLAVAAVVIVCNLSVVASIRYVTLGDTPPSVTDTTEYFHAVGEGRLQIGPARIVYEVMSYFRIKQIAWDAFREHPLTGVGLDRFQDVSARAYREGRLPGRYSQVDPHSSMLGRLAETGLPGGLTLAVLWIGLVATGIRAMRDPAAWPARAAFAGLAGLLIAGINVDIMNFRFFWAAFGLLRAVAPGSSPQPPATTTP
jgi:hypothetical protein